MILAALVALAQAPLSASTSPEAERSIDRINSARLTFRGDALAEHAALTELAGRYLDEIIASRTLIPSVQTSDSATMLYRDVAEAIGDGGLAYRFNGLAVSHGDDIDNAVAAAVALPSYRPALLDPVMDIAGVAYAEVPDGELWLAEPHGGVGEDIDLTGRVIVVIVTAGDFR